MINQAKKIVGLIVLLLVLNSCRQKIEVNKNKPRPMTCLFFFIPDCPASKAVMTPLMKLKEKYQSQGLVVVGILSDPEPNDSILQKVLNENHIDFEIQLDTTLEIAQKRKATTTPQFFLLDSLRNPIYSGLFDNYYYSFGKHRVRVTKNYLEDAIIAYLNDKEPEIKNTQPIGCKINFDHLRLPKTSK
ncbi:MAG: redoxin domain-containing protein [Flavobacteriales bacterium]|nr:redoxin domain-containing protein [Flavobacteriales bacterium]